jgi:hypothetical protein
MCAIFEGLEAREHRCYAWQVSL